MATQQSLRALMIEEMRDLYGAEHLMLQALPVLTGPTSTAEVRAVIERYRQQTDRRLERLKRSLALLDETPHYGADSGVEFLGEDESGVDEELGQAALDARRPDPYMSVIILARRIGEHAIASLLEETLEKERAAEGRLQMLAELSLRSERARPS